MHKRNCIQKVLVLFQIVSFIIIGACEFLFLEAKVPRNDMKMEKKINEILSRMTLDEKIYQIMGKDFMDGYRNERLNIPEFKMTDGPHGVKDTFGEATCFPTSISMAASWDKELVEKAGVALGRETLGKGRNLLLGPCINIHRSPLGGRNFESFTEDPYLNAKMAAAYVKGVQSRKIPVSVKHYAVNNQEQERGSISAEVDERALREIYLPGFEASVVEADAWTFMGAYNLVNGVACCENKKLLVDILKNEWGFRGMVMTDWWYAIKQTVPALNNGLDMEMPGFDNKNDNFFALHKVKDALNKGQVKEETINKMVKRILRVKYLMGLLGGVDIPEGAVNTDEHKKLARHLAEDSMVLLKNEGGVLPINKNKVKTVAVIGPNANEAVLGGGGSSTVKPPYKVSPLEGIKAKCKGGMEVIFAEGCSMPGSIQNTIPPSAFEYNGKPGLKAEYFNNINFQGQPKIDRIDKDINFSWEGNGPGNGIGNDNFSVRWQGELIPPETGEYKLILLSDDGSRLYVNGRLLVDNWGDHGPEKKESVIRLEKDKKYSIKAEFYEKSGGAIMKLGWSMPGAGMLREAVSAAKKADVAVVFVGVNNLVVGEGVDLRDMNLPKGQDELIKAVSDVNKNTVVVMINGNPVDMRKWINGVPAIVEAWFPGQEGGNAIANVLFGDVNPSGRMPTTFPKRIEDNPSYGNFPGGGGKAYYKEGIFVGYRHYDKNDIVPEFSFGHGLSYTSFEYSNIVITPKTSKDARITVKIDVKNTGEVEGKEVVQLYVSDKESSETRPPKELKGFEKINLKPGESKTVEFLLTERDFSYYDDTDNKWVAEPGEFEILIGASSRDIKQKGKFILAEK